MREGARPAFGNGPSHHEHLAALHFTAGTEAAEIKACRQVMGIPPGCMGAGPALALRQQGHLTAAESALHAHPGETIIPGAKGPAVVAAGEEAARGPGERVDRAALGSGGLEP